MKQQNTDETESDVLINLIDKVSEQLLSLYHEIKEERRRLFQEEYDSGNEKFSAFGEIELFSDTINGIAADIIKQGKCDNPSEAISILRKCDIFRIDEFVQWFASYDSYSGYYHYVMLTDYLRRLLIEYIQLKTVQHK